MTILFFLNILFEGLAGLGLIIVPEMMIESSDTLSVSWARTYGVAALIMAILNILILQKRNEVVVLRVGLLIFVLFHIGISIAQGLAAIQGLSPLPVPILHGILAIAFLFFYLKKR